LAIRLEPTSACRRVLLTTVVDSFDPFHCTTELDLKFVPVTLRVKPLPPAVALAGARELITATMLLVCFWATLGGGMKRRHERTTNPVNFDIFYSSPQCRGDGSAKPSSCLLPYLGYPNPESVRRCGQ
jgi:hypothetical protein